MVELTALSSRLVEQMHFLNFHVSHGSATRFLKRGEKYYIYFVDNFQQQKSFQNRLTFDVVIAKFRHHVF